MEEKEEQKRFSGVALAAWSILALLAYAGSIIPIAMLEKRGYLNPIDGTPIHTALRVFYMPLRFLYQNFLPYRALLDFMMGLV